MDTEEIYVDEEMVLSLGFHPIAKDSEWPYTMIYAKNDYTLQYIHPWGQGNMDEGWELKQNGVRIPFKGYRNTYSGKMPNAFILFKKDLDALTPQHS